VQTGDRMESKSVRSKIAPLWQDQIAATLAVLLKPEKPGAVTAVPRFGSKTCWSRQRKGLDKLTMDGVDAEIATARRERRRQPGG
jgi:hypothetical protein